MAEGIWVFGIVENWSTAALDPGMWYDIAREEGHRSMAEWAREETVSENRRRKSEVDKVEAARGVIVGSMKRFIEKSERIPNLSRIHTVRGKCVKTFINCWED